MVEAARWYRAAAEAGSRNGAFNLGLLLAREGSEPRGGPVVDPRRRARGTGGPRCGSRCSRARRGELAEGQRWCARAVELGPAEVAERAARLRDALHQELTA